MLLVGLGSDIGYSQDEDTATPHFVQGTIVEGHAVRHSDRERGDYDFEKLGGIVYSTGEEFRLTCDVYSPELEGPLPAILVIHGGGWRGGSKVHWVRHARKIVRYGYVVVAINYRHAPKFKFPAQVHDVKHAIRFMKKNAEEYNIDPDRIGVYGYSAGGHLAAMLGTTDADDGMEGDIVEGFEEFDTRVRAIAVGGAPTEFTWLGKHSTALSYWLGAGTLANNPELFEQASPTTYITEDDPPFYFYHGSLDFMVPVAAAKVMHDKLEAAGISSTFAEYENQGHIRLFSQTGEPVDKIIEFFDSHLIDKSPDPDAKVQKNDSDNEDK